MEENRQGDSVSEIRTTHRGIHRGELDTTRNEVASAEVHPSPRQAYGESDSDGSVA